MTNSVDDIDSLMGLIDELVSDRKQPDTFIISLVYTLVGRYFDDQKVNRFSMTLLNAAMKRPKLVDYLSHSLPTIPMSEEGTVRFGNLKFPIGKHRGELVEHVSLDYLCYFARQSVFGSDLKRYLASDRIQAEMVAEKTGKRSREDFSDTNLAEQEAHEPDNDW